MINDAHDGAVSGAAQPDATVALARRWAAPGGEQVGGRLEGLVVTDGIDQSAHGMRHRSSLDHRARVLPGARMG
jgi:hypothetical protein